jgi:hypothetical protein
MWSILSMTISRPGNTLASTCFAAASRDGVLGHGLELGMVKERIG